MGSCWEVRPESAKPAADAGSSEMIENIQARSSVGPEVNMESSLEGQRSVLCELRREHGKM